MGSPRVAVVGATGFVGSAVVEALRRRGATVVPVRAPRLRAAAAEVEEVASHDLSDLPALPAASGLAAVVNAAGIADATSGHEAELFGANAALPAVLARWSDRVGARFVHVSSAAVQGRHSPLDDSRTAAPTTPYGRSKHLGEVLALRAVPTAVVYRPPGVHGPGRHVTRVVARVAAHPLCCVAAPGSDGSPQALIEDVADAVAFLALTADPPPPVVTHPASGVTTASLLRLLGDGRSPRMVPRWLARLVVALASSAGRLSPALGANARRLEVLWLGQAQAPSWLTGQGWRPVTTEADWVRLGRAARASSPAPTPTTSTQALTTTTEDDA